VKPCSRIDHISTALIYQVLHASHAFQMTLLDLSGNKFGDKGAQAFLPVLGKVKELKINNCGVSQDLMELIGGTYAQHTDISVIAPKGAGAKSA